MKQTEQEVIITKDVPGFYIAWLIDVYNDEKYIADCSAPCLYKEDALYDLLRKLPEGK